MSPTRPEREQDTCQAPGAPDRAETAVRSTPVTGAADLAAQVELHLSQSRRRRATLALLGVNVDIVYSAGGEVSAHMEQRVREEVSHRIGNAVRGTDTLLRESDRDTCVVMPGANAAVARRVGLRLEHVLEGDYRVDGDLLQVVVRVGGAAHPEHGLRADDLLRRAADRS